MVVGFVALTVERAFKLWSERERRKHSSLSTIAHKMLGSGYYSTWMLLVR